MTWTWLWLPNLTWTKYLISSYSILTHTTVFQVPLLVPSQLYHLMRNYIRESLYQKNTSKGLLHQCIFPIDKIKQSVLWYLCSVLSSIDGELRIGLSCIQPLYILLHFFWRIVWMDLHHSPHLMQYNVCNAADYSILVWSQIPCYNFRLKVLLSCPPVPSH